MKKKIIFKLLICLILSLFTFPYYVNASGSISVSNKTINLHPGQSSTFSITATNSAGRVDIASNSSCISINKNSIFLDNNTEAITVTANSECQTVIKVSVVDAATYDEEVLNNSFSINVNSVAETTTTTKIIEPTKKRSDEGNNSERVTENITREPVTTTSKQEIYLDDLAVLNYNINFSKEVLNYTLEIIDDINEINITAKANSNIKITGTGLKELKYGENIFNIILKDNIGNENTYQLIVDKKNKIVSNNYDSISYYYSNNEDDLIINLDKNKDKLICYKEIVNLIVNNKRKLIYNILDNKKNIYTIELDGSKITKSDYDINLALEIEKNKGIYKKLFKNDFLYIGNISKNMLPNNALLKINIESYLKGNTFNIYAKDEDDLILIKKNLYVIDNYLSFTVDNYKDFLVADETIKNSKSNSFFKIMGILIIIENIIIFGIFIINRNKLFKAED